MTVVKTVGNNNIILEERNICELSWYAIGNVTLMFVLLVLHFYFIRIGEEFLGLLIGSIIITLGVIAFAFDKYMIVHYPSFVVYSNTGREIIHTIQKSTPCNDQVAICKAVKEIEARLIELELTEKMLENIARRCK